MKQLSILTILMVLFVCGINAQVHHQGTIAFIATNPATDPVLCIFGNTIDDVMLITSLIDLNGKEVRNLRQKEEARLHQNITREAQRLKTKFVSFHIVQRRMVEKNGRADIALYFIVEVYERINNKYYLIATNDY